jgi:hypothetical protein
VLGKSYALFLPDALGTLVEMGFWGFTGDMEIQREREKGGRCGGRFPVDGHRAMREVTWDATGGVVARKKISEAANRRDSGGKVRVCRAFGNIKKSCCDRCRLTFVAAGVSFAADVDTVYGNRGGVVLGRWM